MASAAQPTDVGFAEFVTTLLSETVDSIVASQTDQEQRREAMLAAADLELAEFAASYVGDSDIGAKAAELLPDGEGGTTLTVGAAVPPDDVLAALEVRLRASDRGGDGTLTAAGVEKITEALRLLVAGERLRALRSAAHRGLPRVVVDHGRVLARMTFRTVVPGGTAVPAEHAAEEAAAEESVHEDVVDPQLRARVAVSPLLLAQPLTSVRTVASLADAPTITGLSASRLAATLPSAIRDLRMAVHPAQVGDSTQAASANVFGEVEVTFRTVD